MRNIALIGLAFCLACGPVFGQAEPLRVGILADGVSDFWVSLKDAALAKASELGVVLEFRVPAPGTVEQQEALAKQLLDLGIKAMAVCPVKPESQEAFLNTLAGKTTVVTLFKDVPGSSRTAFLGRDDKEVGKLLGQLVKANVPEGLKIQVMCNDPQVPATQARITGLKEEIGESIIVDKVQADKGDRMLTWANVEDTLAKHPEIAGFVGLQEYHGPAILRAVMEKNRGKWVRILGFGADASMRNGLQQGVVQGVVTDDAAQAAGIIMQALAGLARDKNAYPLPETKHIVTPVTVLKTEAALSTEEMMNALKVQVPWMPETSSGSARPGSPQKN